MDNIEHLQNNERRGIRPFETKSQLLNVGQPIRCFELCQALVQSPDSLSQAVPGRRLAILPLGRLELEPRIKPEGLEVFPQEDSQTRLINLVASELGNASRFTSGTPAFFRCLADSSSSRSASPSKLGSDSS